jgi:hypothetical protein
MYDSVTKGGHHKHLGEGIINYQAPSNSFFPTTFFPTKIRNASNNSNDDDAINNPPSSYQPFHVQCKGIHHPPLYNNGYTTRFFHKIKIKDEKEIKKRIKK